MMRKPTAALVLILATLAFNGVGSAAEQSRREVRMLVSTGDNQWVGEWPPVDSPATIEASMNVWQKVYGATRIYWRGMQEARLLRHSYVRPENLYHFDYWQWSRHLDYKVGTNRLAVRAAHKRGMEIWGVDALFDHGAQGDAGGCVILPYSHEDRLRLDHPEWIPVDRSGHLRQGGAIELAYPAARKALCNQFVQLAVKEGYDGVLLFTYIENFNARFDDEFGYSKPIVQDFQRRYGVDIRTQSFDKDAWRNLRGEYITSFLRELKSALSRRHKGLALAVSTNDDRYPMIWLSPPPLKNAGTPIMDWRQWAREGIVDELVVWDRGSGDAFKTTERLLEGVKDTKCRVSFIVSRLPDEWKPFITQGGIQCIFSQPTIGDIGYETDQPASALTSADPLARTRALYQVETGALKADVTQIVAALKDPDVLVRRRALFALGALKDPTTTPAVEAALMDDENTVCCVAAYVLGTVGRPESVTALVRAIRRDNFFQLAETAAVAMGTMDKACIPAIIAGAEDSSWRVRVACICALGRRSAPEAIPVFRKALHDPHPYVRFRAAWGLGRLPAAEAISDLFDALPDRDVTAQAQIAETLASTILARTRPGDPLRARGLAALTDLFRQFGDGCKRRDAEWGWRTVGNALRRFGGEGAAALEGMIAQKSDHRLRECAFQVLKVPHEVMSYNPVTEEEAAAALGSWPTR